MNPIAFKAGMSRHMKNGLTQQEAFDAMKRFVAGKQAAQLKDNGYRTPPQFCYPDNPYPKEKKIKKIEVTPDVQKFSDENLAPSHTDLD